MNSNDTVTLLVWSDYVCPFCYLEKPELDALKSHFGERLRIEWRAFELRPDPVPTLDPDGDYLHDTWNRAVYPMAQERDMALRLPRLQPRSRLAHEAAKWAVDHEAFEAMHTALFRGFFEDSVDLADPLALVAIAQHLGLDGKSLERYLAEGKYRQAVLADQQEAQRLNISGVPAMVLVAQNEILGQIQGAQPSSRLKQAVAPFLP